MRRAGDLCLLPRGSSLFSQYVDENGVDSVIAEEATSGDRFVVRLPSPYANFAPVIIGERMMWVRKSDLDNRETLVEVPC